MGSKSGASLSSECVEAYNDLKLGKKVKYIIYKLSDDFKEVVVEDKSEEADWEAFRTKLLNAKQVSKGKEAPAPRYAVYDFEYTREGGEGQRNVLAFISWSPDEGSTIHLKMVYSSSKEALKRALTGIGAEVQATSEDDIEYETILKEVTRGKR